jgi:hypothetical protein
MQKRQAEFTGNMENSKVTEYPWWMPLDTVGKPKVAPTGMAKL